MVDDVAVLESEWVKSSDPYPISLNLRQIKNILNNDEYMDIHCFNMAVRILARHEVQLLRDIPSHYMDLNFCSMFHYARDSSHRENVEIATLKRLFHSWPDSNDYHISQCNTILLPWYMFGLFLLFVLDQNKKVVSIFDPIPIPTLGNNVLKIVVDNLNLALEVANPAFKDDISKWECIVPVAPTNSRCALSGYLVFNYMHSLCDGKLYFPIPNDGFQLRKQFLVHLLKYEENEAQNNIPYIERSIIDRIYRWTFIASKSGPSRHA
uniref:Uncharacterized protein n=1 Tax=Triticum urartu TaxID=4572 RepID=A0A8R7PFM4_TRIUA